MKFFAEIKMKPNLIQTGAINLDVCIDDKPEKTEHLAAAATTVFDVQIERGLTLLTIRHFYRTITKHYDVAKRNFIETANARNGAGFYTGNFFIKNVPRYFSICC